ncbi:MAG: hypothetical protein RIB67_08400 [Miltoncostaeaceae bacterium]
MTPAGTRRRRGRPGARGQAAVEVLAAVPAVLLAALLAWQLVAVVGAGLRAQDIARERAMSVPASAPAVTVTVRERVTVVLPGLGRIEVPAVAVGGRP